MDKANEPVTELEGDEDDRYSSPGEPYAQHQLWIVVGCSFVEVLPRLYLHLLQIKSLKIYIGHKYLSYSLISGQQI